MALAVANIILEISDEVESTGSCGGSGLAATYVSATAKEVELVSGGCGGGGSGATTVSATARDVELVPGGCAGVGLGASVVSATAGEEKLVASESAEDSECAFSSTRNDCGLVLGDCGGCGVGGCGGGGLEAVGVPREVELVLDGCGRVGLGATAVSATAGEVELVLGVCGGDSLVATAVSATAWRRASSSLKEFIMSDCVGIGGAPDCELVPHVNAGSATAGDGELASSANAGPVSAGFEENSTNSAILRRASAFANVFSATAGVSATAGDCWPSVFGNSRRCQSWSDASGGAIIICSCEGAHCFACDSSLSTGCDSSLSDPRDS